ncbi:MAG: molybdenum cofactor biosynthesis protein MoaE [Nitriliruptorales bacterium]|nr:molybdenum cofactor biosynthesis protein MoaE [Nitriliruptorales bacterium]
MTDAARHADVEVVLTSDVLRVEDAVAHVTRPDCGGIGVFLGVVRDEGGTVAALEYEAWEEAADPAMRTVADTVLDAHPDVRAVYLAHRLGRLAVGETSVIVAASAPHRPAAFAATRALIDELKAEVPIWKREEFRDGSARWPGTDSDAQPGPRT